MHFYLYFVVFLITSGIIITKLERDNGLMVTEKNARDESLCLMINMYR